MQQKFLLVFLFIVTIAFGQRGAEAGVISDNDLYFSSVNDKYYTNGFEFYYRYTNKKKKENINKKMTEFKIGQYIYVPYTRFAVEPERNDRPFAGYLFIEAGQNIFYQNESVLKMNLQLGFVGPNAFGEETQHFFHKNFGYKRIYGWENQIRNAFAVQGNMFFSKEIFPNFNDKIDFHVQADVNFGTVWDGITTGILSRMSLKPLLPIYNSNLHGASTNADRKIYKDEREFYFYVNPGVNYQLYDTTVTGSLFSDNSPVTRSIIPFRLNLEAGFKYRKNNWNLSYVFIYKGKEVRMPRNTGYFYGSITIGHML
ncbi:lipid A-modifier LpxR family protein [Flavobacterium sp. 3HN19-14]|uniref:lipid A-modifier LpxR family protein n=1 Tax=Flavobacterium sp. 3HN19-14 TaxID=3448133 RepID=UPI003EE28E81